MKLRWNSVKSRAILLMIGALVCFGIYLALTKEHSRPGLPEPASPVSDHSDGEGQLELLPDTHTGTHSDPGEAGALTNESGGESWVVLNEHPHVAYLRFLDRAEAGDARAQLMLTEILERCRYSSVQSPERLAALEARGDVSPEMLADYQAKLDECGDLYKMLEEYDLDSLWALWMEEASGKLPVAKIALAMASLELEYSDALYRDLQAGVTAAKGDWIQERVIRQLALAFFRTFVEPMQNDASVEDAGYYLRGEDSLAWDYLGCANSVHCDLKAFKQQAADNYYEYQINDMYKRANELDRALEEGDWARLGLKRMPDNG